MDRRFFLKYGAAASALAFPAWRLYGQPADTLVLNGRVRTMDASEGWSEAVAMAGGRILATGSSREIGRLRCAGVRTIDARGKLVLPGLTDSHLHFLEGSLTLLRVRLDGATSVREIQERVRQYAAAHPGDSWIQGRGWVYSSFGAAALPDKKDLDAILPHRPAYLRAYDGHTAWVNSKALALAGITKNTPNPPGGIIVRDPATGEPTGALKERPAQDLIRKAIPPPGREEKLNALRTGLAEARRLGLARVHSAGFDFPELELYQDLRSRGELTIRMYLAHYLAAPNQPAGTWLDELQEAHRRYRDEWLDAGAVKLYLDGVIESHTAALLAPYSDDPTVSGKLFWEPEQYKRAVVEVDRQGYQVFTHAIGDAAVRLALDAYGNAATVNKRRDARHRVEHMETVSAQDIPRFRELNVIASMQPLHADPGPNGLEVWARNAGPDRSSRGFAWQSILKAGGRLAFGSDWPVVTMNPFEGMQTAVTRQTKEGLPPGGWEPRQRVSISQAVDAYTLGAAFAGHRERTEGSLEAGKRADLVILSQNLFEIDPHRIGETQVLLNVVGGKIVYHAPGW